MTAADCRAVGLSARRFEMFFVLYFFMTGLHAIHMIIGIVLVGVMAYLVAATLVLRRRRPPDRGDRASTGTSSTWSGSSSIPLLYLIDVHS